VVDPMENVEIVIVASAEEVSKQHWRKQEKQLSIKLSYLKVREKSHEKT
jgi:hypothetical protein